jgi:curved DNA binding protein
VTDICRAGDTLIESKAKLVYKNKVNGKVVEKGIAFPVCVSVNECVCHCSPLESDTLTPLLAEGDLVKIDLGAHVDGLIAVTAYTVRVGATAEPVEGALADCFHAAWAAAEVAAKLIRPGNTNAMVTAAVKKIAEAYGVNAIAGTLMHQMKKYVIDGSKMVLLREEGEKVDPCTFEQYETYAIDVAMSTGAGKPRDEDTRTTVYKRVVNQNYDLKNKSSRTFFNEVNKR